MQLEALRRQKLREREKEQQQQRQRQEEQQRLAHPPRPGDIVSTDRNSLTRIEWSEVEDAALEYAVRHIGLEWRVINYSYVVGCTPHVVGR